MRNPKNKNADIPADVLAAFGEKPAVENNNIPDDVLEAFGVKKKDGGALNKPAPVVGGGVSPTLSQSQEGEDTFHVKRSSTSNPQDFYSGVGGNPVKPQGTYKNNPTIAPEKPQRSGYMWNKLIDGVASVIGGASDNVMNLMTSVLPDAVVGDTHENAMKQYREEVAPIVKNQIKDQLHTDRVSSEQQKQYDDEFLTSAVGGLVSSIPAMIAPKGAKFVALVSQAQDGAMESINSSEAGKALPESTKTSFALGTGVVVGLMDKFALDKIFGKASSKVASKITSEVLSEWAKKGAGKITAEAFEKLAQDKLKGLSKQVIAKGGKIVQAGILEGVTEGLQEGVTIGAEQLVNLSENKRIFEPASWGGSLARVARSAAAGAVGGGALGGVSVAISSDPQAKNYISDKVANAKTPEDIQALKSELSENMPVEQAEEVHALVDEYARVNQKIPESHPNRKEAIEKIMEREDIDEAIEKKTQEIEQLDEAFKPEAKKELAALEGRASELNEEIANPKTPIAETTNDARNPSPTNETPIVVSENVGQSQKQGDKENVSSSAESVGNGNAKVADAVLEKFPELKGTKVADEKGNPVLVHHGTQSEFENFEIPSYMGDVRFATEGGADMAMGGKAGIYFTSNEESAKTYSELKKGKKGTVKSVYLDIKNPVVIDAGGKAWTGRIADEYTSALKKIKLGIKDENGNVHDGVIVKNVIDAANEKPHVGDVYAVTDPKQIKQLPKGKSEPTNPQPKAPQEGQTIKIEPSIKGGSEVRKEDLGSNQSFTNRFKYSVDGGELEISERNGRYSVTSLSVDEGSRRKGIATSLLKKAIEDTNENISAQVSNDGSAELHHKLGMRSYKDGKELSLAETKKEIADHTSVNMRFSNEKLERELFRLDTERQKELDAIANENSKYNSEKKRHSKELDQVLKSKGVVSKEEFKIKLTKSSIPEQVKQLVLDGKIDEAIDYLKSDETRVKEKYANEVINARKRLPTEKQKATPEPTKTPTTTNENTNNKATEADKQGDKPTAQESKPTPKPTEIVKEPTEKTFEERTDKEHATYIKDKFKKEFTAKGIAPEQVDAAVALLEARAKVANPENPDAYYRKIQDIGSGEFQNEANEVLNQIPAPIKKAAKWAAVFGTIWNLNAKIPNKVFQHKSDKTSNFIIKQIAENDFVYVKKNGVISDLSTAGSGKANAPVSKFILDLWAKAGYPKINIDTRPGGRSTYSGATNEINLRVGLHYGSIPEFTETGEITGFGIPSDVLFAEMSHALQATEGKLTVGRTISDFVKSKFDYEKSYEIEGTIENEAHSKIQPTIEKEYSAIRKQINEVLYQESKGAVETLANGRKIIHALESPDFSTTVHEIAHVFEGEISAAEKQVIQDWAGTKEWNKETSETFARGFERYLRDGKAPTTELAKIFEQAKEWLKTIYEKLAGSPIAKKITPEVKEVFDNLFKGKKSEKAGIEPPKTPTENVGKGESEPIGLAHADTEAKRAEYGLEDREQWEAKTAETRNAEADKIIKDGKLPKLIKAVEEGHNPSGAEHFAMVKYAAELDGQIKEALESGNTDKVNKLQKDYDKVASASELAGSRQGEAFQARKEKLVRDGSLSSVLSDLKNDTGVEELTPTQMAEGKKRFEELEKANKAFEEKNEQLQKEKAELAAQLEFEKAKKEVARQKSGAAKKKSPEDYKKERDEIRQSIKEKWMNAGAQANLSVPFAPQLIAIAPDVARLVKSYIGQDVNIGLDAVRKLLKKDLEDFGVTVTDEEVRAFIAGEVTKPKQTRNEAAARSYELKQEEKLLLAIEAAERGEAITEKQKQSKNQKLKDLRQKLDDLYKAAKIGKFSDEARFETAIKQRISQNKKEQAKLQQKVDEGDFAPDPIKQSILENKELQKRFPKLYDEFVKSSVAKDEAKLDYERKRIEDKMKNRKLGRKVLDAGGTILMTSKGAVAMVDQSSVLVQALVFTGAHPIEASKYIAKAGRDLFNPKRFNRAMAAIHNSPMWPVIEKSGLAFYEPRSAKSELRNELHGGDKNLLNKAVKIGNQKFSIGQSFERSVSTYLNNARLYMFMQQAESLMQQGKTFENSPESYKGAARVANELTGHGKIHEGLQQSGEVLNKFIWSPKMLSSTMNVLGLGDAVHLGDNPGFYRSLPAEQKAYAAKEIARFLGTAVAITIAGKMTGAIDDYDLNPLSSGFGSIKKGDKSVSLFGRYGSAMRTIAQVAANNRYVRGRYNELGDKFGEKDAADVAFGSFGRGKMTPAAGMAYDYFLHGKKNYYTGEKMTAKNVAKNMLIPMSFNSIPDFIKNDGAIKGISEILLQVYGGNIKDEGSFKQNAEEIKAQNIQDTYTDEDLKNPNFKYLSEKGVRKPTTQEIGAYEIPIDDNHPEGFMNDEEYAKFKTTREKLIDDGITTFLKKKSYSVSEKGRVVDKDIKKLSTDQVKEVIKSISSKATTQAKKEMGFEKTEEQKELEKELKSAREDDEEN